MFAIQNAIRHAPQVQSLLLRRTIVSTPPTVRVSFVEKCAHGIALLVGIMGPAIYVSCQFKRFKPEDEF